MDKKKTLQPTKKRWIICPLVPASVNQELREYSPFLRQLLYNRGIIDANAARAFVAGNSPTQTDSLQLKDMREAVAILHQAIENGDKIAVYGDYDADGVTSSALLFELLSQLGSPPLVYIPNRFDEGYGLNLEAVEQLANEGISLVITVDCGIRSVDEVALAREHGMRVILTDHHLPGHTLPPADAIINPRQPGDPYPFKELAGVGLAFKLAEGYLALHPNPAINLEDWLDLVAIGTVADLAPLTGENRALVKAGLNQMRQVKRQGLFSLCQVAGIKPDKVNAGNIGFGIGPRLNAAGRIASAMEAFELLTSRDLFQAAVLAQKLDNQNTQRKDITFQVQTAAIEQALAADADSPLIFAASTEFNDGVVGLAASKIVESLYRPALIGHIEGDFIKASCRSIAEFDITHALDECADLLVRHGGHSMAAGFTVKQENASELIRRMTDLARQAFDGQELIPTLNVDYEISLEKLRREHIPQILEDIDRLEPTGRENPEALFCSSSCRVTKAYTVSDGQHLKMTLAAGDQQYDAIAFRQGYWLENLPERIDVAYAFEINSYMGRQSLQLNIRDIKASQPEA